MNKIYPINHYPALDFRDDDLLDKEMIIIMLKGVIGDSSQPTGQFVDPNGDEWCIGTISRICPPYPISKLISNGDKWSIGTIARDRNEQQYFIVDENYVSPPFIRNANGFYKTAKAAKEAVIETHRRHREQRAEVGGEDFEIVICYPATGTKYSVLRVTPAGEYSEDERHKVWTFGSHAAAESLCDTLDKEGYDSRPAADDNRRPTYRVCIRDVAGDRDIRPFADRPSLFSTGF